MKLVLLTGMESQSHTKGVFHYNGGKIQIWAQLWITVTAVNRNES
jgi:hypothetical protein